MLHRNTEHAQGCSGFIFLTLTHFRYGWLWFYITFSDISAIYSDGTVVQFQNLGMLPGTQHHGQLGVLHVPSVPRHGHWDVRRRFNLLAIRGPTMAHARWVCRGSNQDLPINSPARYLYATATGTRFLGLPTCIITGISKEENCNFIEASYTELIWLKKKPHRFIGILILMFKSVLN